MRKIGLIVAVEEAALRQKYGEGYDLNDGYGTVLYQTAKSQVYALYSGAGEIFAAAQHNTLSTATKSLRFLITA